jgi:hypothetical protein
MDRRRSGMMFLLAVTLPVAPTYATGRWKTTARYLLDVLPTELFGFEASQNSFGVSWHVADAHTGGVIDRIDDRDVRRGEG